MAIDGSCLSPMNYIEHKAHLLPSLFSLSLSLLILNYLNDHGKDESNNSLLLLTRPRVFQ